MRRQKQPLLTALLLIITIIPRTHSGNVLVDEPSNASSCAVAIVCLMFVVAVELQHYLPQKSLDQRA
jgi:hypothetical protein